MQCSGCDVDNFHLYVQFTKPEQWSSNLHNLHMFRERMDSTIQWRNKTQAATICLVLFILVNKWRSRIYFKFNVEVNLHSKHTFNSFVSSSPKTYVCIIIYIGIIFHAVICFSNEKLIHHNYELSVKLESKLKPITRSVFQLTENID